jgi:hypothetical protein
LPNPDNNPLGRLEHQSKQFRAMQQQLGERGAGKMAFELGQKADAIDEKIWQYRDKARSERMAGSTSQERQARVMIDQRAEDMLNSGSDPAAVMEWKRTAERQVAEQIFTAPKTHVDPATGTVTTSEVALPEALGGRTSPSSKAKIEYGDRAFDKETGAFAERLDKNKVLNVIQPINVIDRINKITASSPDGLGGLRNTTAGRWFNTAQGASYKASVERLISAEIYDDSGAAISIPEEERARLRAMLSVANTAADYIQIYNEQIKPRWEFAARNVIGSANPKVVAQWQKNSGIDLTGWVKDISTPAKITGSDKTTRRIKSDAEYDSLPSGSMFIGPDGKTRRKP